MNYNRSPVSAGSAHTLVIDADQQVWGFGSNFYGEIGHHTGKTIPMTNYDSCRFLTPTIIENLPLITHVSTSKSGGNAFSLLVDESGSVWGAGDNFDGQLGIGSSSERQIEFQLNTFLPEIQTLSCGSRHTLFLDTQGNVWVCGRNSQGQLGLGHTTDCPTPTQLTGLPKIRQIQCTSQSSFLLCENGRVWGAGLNEGSVLGLLGSPIRTFTEILHIPPMKAISACYRHAVLTDYNGKVWSNPDAVNQLYYSFYRVSDKSVRCATASGNESSFIDLDGTVYVKTRTITGGSAFAPIAGIPAMKSVYGGNYNTFYEDEDGYLWAKGANNEGQLGVGDKLIRTEPTKVLQIGPVWNKVSSSLSSKSARNV